MHSTDHPHAAVQTRDGGNCNYCRYPAFGPPQSQSPFNPRTHTPACHETHSAPYHSIRTHPGRRGRMFVHGDRHLPCIQRPHTRCHSHHTRRSLSHRASVTHTTPLTPAGALTRGVSCTHRAFLTHTGALTRGVSLAHRASHTRAVSGCGSPFTHGVPGSTHAGTLATTSLAHGGSFVHG